MRLTLLVRAYCHLCDEMAQALLPLARAHDATVDIVDVDAPEHAALEDAWGDRVPALFAGAPEKGLLLCTIRFDPAPVVAALSTAPGSR